MVGNDIHLWEALTPEESESLAYELRTAEYAIKCRKEGLPIFPTEFDIALDKSYLSVVRRCMATIALLPFSFSSHVISTGAHGLVQLDDQERGIQIESLLSDPRFQEQLNSQIRSLLNQVFS